MPKLDLASVDLLQVQPILKQWVPHCEVWATRPESHRMEIKKQYRVIQQAD